MENIATHIKLYRAPATDRIAWCNVGYYVQVDGRVVEQVAKTFEKKGGWIWRLGEAATWTKDGGARDRKTAVISLVAAAQS